MLGVLKQNADSSFRPPGLPASAPLTDAVVHSADIRWALGDDHADWAPAERLLPVLDFLISRQSRLGFVPPRRLQGVRLVAEDLGWAHGRGAEVRGSGLIVVLGVLGRTAALPQLSGDGVTLLTR